MWDKNMVGLNEVGNDFEEVVILFGCFRSFVVLYI